MSRSLLSHLFVFGSLGSKCRDVFPNRLLKVYLSQVSRVGLARRGAEPVHRRLPAPLGRQAGAGLVPAVGASGGK